MCEEIIEFIKNLYPNKEFIPLHEPRFKGNEKKYVNECIESTFVSSIGKFVDRFEANFAAYVGAKYAVAFINGTMALFTALKVAGVQKRDEVLTQSLTFVATANAISYLDAHPVFLDVDRDTLGLSPDALTQFLENHTFQKDGHAFNKSSGNRILACLPMHTFGHPCRIVEIKRICQTYNLTLVEDSAESVGSTYMGQQTGTFGKIGVFSFNGNKTITTGGGGMIVTDDESIAAKVKHLTTTAKVPHAWEFNHDEIGYNFRMPNLNAALGVAQLEQLSEFLKCKKQLAVKYRNFFKVNKINFVEEPANAQSNNWINSILLKGRQQRDDFLEKSNQQGIMTRPLWTAMHKLPMYRECLHDGLENTTFLEDRLVNLPSSVIV